MIRVSYGKNFLRSVQELPLPQQKKLSKLISLLEENPYHPLLHTKHLRGGLSGYLSFRVTRGWRVIFQFLDPETVQLLHVAHRSEIYC